MDLKMDEIVPEKKFKCDTCNDHFPQKISLNKHIKEVHERKKNEVICKICENTFRTQQSLKRHVVSIQKKV